MDNTNNVHVPPKVPSQREEEVRGAVWPDEGAEFVDKFITTLLGLWLLNDGRWLLLANDGRWLLLDDGRRLLHDGRRLLHDGRWLLVNDGRWLLHDRFREMFHGLG
jgi:hypothetical protein